MSLLEAPVTPDSSRQVREAYDAAAVTYHSMFCDELAGKPFDRRLLDRFAAAIPPCSHVLDAGCGPCAQIGERLHDRGAEVIALDISLQCVRLARGHHRPFTLMQADFAALPFANGSFAGVVSYYSIVHTAKSDVDHLFREFRRVLRPSGLLLVAVKEGSDEEVVHSFLGSDSDVIFSRFTTEEVSGSFKRNGFDLIALEERDPYPTEIQNRRIYAIGART